MIVAGVVDVVIAVVFQRQLDFDGYDMSSVGCVGTWWHVGGQLRHCVVFSLPRVTTLLGGSVARCGACVAPPGDPFTRPVWVRVKGRLLLNTPVLLRLGDVTALINAMKRTFNGTSAFSSCCRFLGVFFK